MISSASFSSAFSPKR
uniref:Uncharacterized protein n=1 Tax=Arundo donax TaxID=35708 RepID=A0A0A9FHJ3_ARUDO